MVGLTISDATAEEMEEDFDEVCLSLERIITRQHERIIQLEAVAKALTDWWEAPDPDNLHDDIVLFKKMFAMAKRALKP